MASSARGGEKERRQMHKKEVPVRRIRWIGCVRQDERILVITRNKIPY